MPSITLTIPADSGGTTLLNDFCDATDYEGDGSAKDKRGHLKAHVSKGTLEDFHHQSGGHDSVDLELP
jgi:hypothetical protein